MSNVQPTRILYIEDDIVTATCVQTQLEQRGYVVDLAMDGKNGLTKLEEKPYDVVAVDYHLPGMNGLQVLQNLVESKEMVPTIMITGAGNERIAVEAMKLGAGDYLIKDIDNHYLELLPEVIECELEKRQLITEKQRAKDALHYRDTILEAVSFAAEKFLTCAHWAEPIQEVLACLGQAVAASRVYIFENHRNEPGLLRSCQCYEWVANGIAPQIDNPEMQNLPLEQLLPRWVEILKQGQPLYGLVKDFPKSEAEIFAEQEILSMAVCPIFVGQKWWGIIGYDDCLEEREWLPVVIETFKMAANLLGAAIEHEQMNKALRESEARLAKTQRIAHLGHCDWDLATNTRYLSEETLKILGWPRDNHLVSNERFVDALHPEDRKIVQKAIEQTIQFNEPYDIEFRIIRPDGTIRSIHALSELFRDDGKPSHFLGTVLDITEHKQIEKALRESTQTLSAILNAATDSIVMTELDTTCVMINPAGAARLGRTVDEVVGQHLCDLVAPEVATFRATVVDQVIHTKQPKRFEDEERKNLWFEHSIYPVFDDLGSVTRIAVVSRDITKRKQAEDALDHTLAEQKIILDNSLVGIAFINEERQFVRINRKLEEMCGYTSAELNGHPTEILYFSSEDYKNVGEQNYPLIRKGATYEMEHLMRRKDGTPFWCCVKVKVIDPNALSKGYIWNLEDVTEKRQIEENQRLAATVFETTTEGILVTNADNHIIMVNPAFTAITGYTLDEVVGKDPNLLNSGHHNASFYQDMWKSLVETGKWQGELWNRRKNGEIYVEWVSMVVIRDASDSIVQYVAVFSDITKRKQTEDLIWHQAHYDALTELPNRTLFADRLTHAVQTAKRQQAQLAVMFIDLDRFKWVNDTLGHKAGDQLLKEAAQRLVACVRESDTVARLGGDEFTVILNQIESMLNLKNIAERVLNNLSQPFKLDNHKITIAGSIGIALFPEDGQDAETLLKNADIAMYQAKEGGRNAYQFFTQQMNVQVTEHLRLENALRRALTCNEFTLHYQPILALDSEQIIGAEAHLRWSLPTEHQRFLEQFLPVAEETGLIIPIGQWCLKTAAHQLKEWHKMGFTFLQMAVNVSAYQLRSPLLLDTITEVLKDIGLPPNVLILQITEEVFLEKMPENVTTLCKLEELGVQIALDNFGSGGASLHSLRQFPIHLLKIDPFFVHHATVDAYDAILVKAIIALAHERNIKVIGSGVETEEQLTFLRLHHCDLAQGRCFSKPLIPEGFEQFVSQYFSDT
jgi:diguanylate cyclase (GGDEF)-like protein/PAS domain S-box-containing protein